MDEKKALAGWGANSYLARLFRTDAAPVRIL
jgi:hypothetical protein